MKNPEAAGGEARGRRGLGQKETAMTRKSRVMIFGPKPDGTYVVEFRRPMASRSGGL
jgi:hypothetical protein